VKIVYSPLHKELVYINQTASSGEYWDLTWEKKLDPLALQKARTMKKNYFTDITSEFLKVSEGPIIEGGCGFGAQVMALSNFGYEVCGVDFAEGTICHVKKMYPELDLQVGNLEALPFPDSTFSGYWSIGVIEHFWNGYEKMAIEMRRVLKPSGYLFLTFPHMSLVRKLKAKLGFYTVYNSIERPEEFYQFALDSSKVKNFFQDLGFEVVAYRGKSGISGFQKELPKLSRVTLPFARSYLRRILEIILDKYSGHSALVVLKKI
jgi:ubiquinone/menaquinone biosynthesis C-methylase UbiE